jgi:hypothetical protein
MQGARGKNRLISTTASGDPIEARSMKSEVWKLLAF